MENVRIVHTDSGKPIVSGISFALDRGRCLGIVGESGSGKTLVCRALLGDEPVTALDARNQHDVLQRFRQLREEHQATLIFVSHDLGAVQMLADSVLVMCRGRCVEAGDAHAVFNSPRHPYTQYLVSTRLALTRGFHRMLGGHHARA